MLLIEDGLSVLNQMPVNRRITGLILLSLSLSLSFSQTRSLLLVLPSWQLTKKDTHNMPPNIIDRRISRTMFTIIWVSERPNLDEEPPIEHDKYEFINGRLSGLFAKHSWEQAVIKNQVCELGFPEALRQDKGCTALRFDWSNPVLKDCMGNLGVRR